MPPEILVPLQKGLFQRMLKQNLFLSLHKLIKSRSQTDAAIELRLICLSRWGVAAL